MRLLIVSQYFWPETFLINKLCQKLHHLGHQVTVITGKPNYPEGEIFSGYKALGVEREEYCGLEVIRIPLQPRKKGAFGLVKNYLSFVISGLWYMPRLLKGRQYDAMLVYAISPITAAIPAILLKRKLGAHLAVWVQDLWPQSLSATGYIKNRLVLGLVGSIVRWIYRHTDTLLGQSQAFVKAMEEYATEDKIFYYPNSIEPLVIDSEVTPGIDTSCFGIGFSVVFAGNIGKAQSIPTLIEAASKLSGTDCQLIFVGEGSMLDWARQESSRLGLTNTHFLGWVDNKSMPWIYQKSNGLIVSLTDEEIFSYTIPGKLQTCLAAGKPIIASLNGEAADVIEVSGAGIAVPAEDSDRLAKAILKLRNMNEQQLDELGSNGRRYFQEHYDVNVQAPHLIEILEQRIRGVR